MTLRIVRDSREQNGFSFGGYDCVVEDGSLATGDYSLAGLEGVVAVERKSLDDLIGCLAGERERFERELARGRGLDFFAVVVEAGWEDLAGGRYRSRMKPHAACQSILAMMQRWRCPFFFGGSREGAEYAAYWLLSKFLRETVTRLETIQKKHGAGGNMSVAPAALQ